MCPPSKNSFSTFTYVDSSKALRLKRVFCCFGNSVASTRFLLQDEFNIQTTQCDNCTIARLHVLSATELACICSLVACIIGNNALSDVAHVISCMSNLVYCLLWHCKFAIHLQTQHKVEMDKRDARHVEHHVWYVLKKILPSPPDLPLSPILRKISNGAP
ncbi:uncharacterized protein LOC112873031 [Panicum hallii]|uniref:uncharacterized protein LOC112873031 n=1 Tax=Panicum hallii TaxID=206008 RepID=UPI000DF4CC01|nr:uncharacterized protein LOC112873031 [Panicum hallii]